MYKILLCLRYLKTRYIALACIVSVLLGVATMIVVNSVMAGFSTEMRDRIRGILADIVVETNSLDGAADAQKHLEMVEKAAGEHIEGMTATVEVYGMLSFQYAGQWITRPVTLIGIKPEGKAKVGPLVDYLVHSESDADWKLSSKATAYRKQRIKQQQLFLEEWENEEAPNQEYENAQSENPFDQLAEEAQAEAQSGENSSEDLETPSFASDDPFTAQDKKQTDQFEDDSYAPLQGRLYVGAGLISYPYENRETGEIETKMMVEPGDDVRISTVTAGRPPNATHDFATVVDIFKSGMSEYDSNLVFCNLEHLQQMRGMIDPQTGTRSITSIQIKLKDYEHADEVVERLSTVFPPGAYSVRTWEQKQGPLLAAVEVESAILNVLLFLIIAVAGFGILAIFFMIVVEKTRDIGILKALGAGSRGVMTIFLSYGLALGIVGSGVGVIAGLFFVHYINAIESWVTWLTGRKVFDERIYYFPEIPTSVDPMMVFWVALGAMTIAVLASILPARRAARLHPVEALRYE